tara:strand:- start:278 stop:766 length:489 start_codon:yes stop_codon:yes gene_type:complete
MRTLRDKIVHSWGTLQHREKVIILAGFSVLAATAVYLVFASAWSVRTTLLQEKTALLAEQNWMQEQSTLAGQLLNNCRDNQILALGQNELLDLLATRNLLQTGTISSSGTSYSLQVESADGNNILRFIHQSACQGFILTSVQIDKAESSDHYSGQVEFRHEG